MGPMVRASESDMIRLPLNEHLIGKSARIREVNELVRRLARTDLSVLITGESGTGKEITARMLHRLSARDGKPFVKVNCPAIPESILESELFGFERGAFTGARGAKPGRFELAHQGTIFLDEIAETPIALQGKLLQMFDGEPIMRIGGVKPIGVDVRILAATNVPLDEAVRNGRMREDMYFRLSEMHIHLPALAERTEDIPLLVEHFNYNYCKRQGKDYRPIPQSVLDRMGEQAWPGNVRELGSRVKRYVTSGDTADLLESGRYGTGAFGLDGAGEFDGAAVVSPPGNGAHSAGKGRDAPRTFPSLKEAAREAVEKTERNLIEDALRHTLWNRRKAAKLLDISYSSLLRRIDAYNIGKTDEG